MKFILAFMISAVVNMMAYSQDDSLAQTNSMSTKITVEIWSDVVCPFCYIGKRNFENALKQFDGKENVEIIWHSFQLNPDTPENSTQTSYEYLAESKGITLKQSMEMHENVIKMAKKAGLDYNYDKAIVANTFNAHRFLQFAKTKHLGDEAKERLLSGYFIEGKNIGDSSVLIELGKAIGLTEVDVNEALTNPLYAEKVVADIQEAQNLGITGVPFFVINRKYGISGAQPIDVFLENLEKMNEELK